MSHVLKPLTHCIFSLPRQQMRTFHISWLTFFACFLAGSAWLPDAAIGRSRTSKEEVGNTIIAAVLPPLCAVTGWRLCDTGPAKNVYCLTDRRRIPVMLVGLAESYNVSSFSPSHWSYRCLICYHSISHSLMFAPAIKHGQCRGRRVG